MEQPHEERAFSGNANSCGGASQNQSGTTIGSAPDQNSAILNDQGATTNFSISQVGPTPFPRPPLLYCGQGASFPLPSTASGQVDQSNSHGNLARSMQQQQPIWTPAANYTAPNPFSGGFYGFPPELAQLQLQMKSLEQRLDAQNKTSASRPSKRSSYNKKDRQIHCVSESEVYSDVSSGDDFSGNEDDLYSDNEFEHSFQNLKSSSSTQDTLNKESGPSTSNIDKLNRLSKDFEEKNDFTEKVNDKLASTINAGMKSVHSKTACRELMDKYLVPSNCDHVRVPLINPELWNSDTLVEPYRSNDKILYKNHRITTKAMLPIIQIMNKCLEDNSTTDIFDLACDAFQLLSYGHRDMTMVRRQFLKPAVSRQYRKLCQSSAPATEHLFGDDLQKQMRDLNETHKLTQDFAGRKSKSRPSPYNQQPSKKPRFDKDRTEFRQKSFLERKARPHYKKPKSQGSGRKNSL